MLADAIMPAPIEAPGTTLGDEVDVWLKSLRHRHGPDEMCEMWDCYPCWVRWTEEEVDDG